MKLLLAICLLCISLISCGEDSSTNPQDNQEFDYSIQSNMQWEYEINDDGKIKNSTWYSSEGDAPDGKAALKMLMVNEGETKAEVEKQNRYSYFSSENSTVLYYKNSISSNLINDRIENNSYWEKIISTDEENWTIADIEYDSTYSHGLIVELTISITGELIEETKVDFQGEERRAIITKVLKKIKLTSKIETQEDLVTEEYEETKYTYIEGVGFYNILIYRKGQNVNREEIESTDVLQLVDYKLQSQ